MMRAMADYRAPCSANCAGFVIFPPKKCGFPAHSDRQRHILIRQELCPSLTYHRTSPTTGLTCSLPWPQSLQGSVQHQKMLESAKDNRCNVCPDQCLFSLNENKVLQNKATLLLHNFILVPNVTKCINNKYVFYIRNMLFTVLFCE